MLECVHLPRSVFCGFNCQFQVCWLPTNNSHYVGQTSGLPAPRYRGAVIIVLTVAVPLAPQGGENSVRRQISVSPIVCSK